MNFKGKAITLKDSKGATYPNGISTRQGVMINGKKQYMFIVGEDKDNPVLLFLHGGPGSPEVGMCEFIPGKRLEERFTVCYWEQRGSCLSYGAKVKPKDMTMELMVSDTMEVTKYLIKKFNQEQIYIMGHSWGTLLGIKTISKKPEYYKAYFGIGQISNQKESEKLAYKYMLEHAREMEDIKAIKILEKFDVNSPDFPTNKYIMSDRTNYMNEYGIGIIHEEGFRMSTLIKRLMIFEGYSVFDFIKYALGGMYSNKTIFQDVLKANLMETHRKFKVPIYILHGKYDMQVSHELALQYYNIIEAPDKGFFTFDESAHSPNFEEVDKFLEIVFSKLE